MRGFGVLIVGFVVACMLGLGPARVWAQETPGGSAPSAKDARARDLWVRGNQLFEEGKYEQALAAFEESYRLSKRPGTLVALANTYELLGRLEEAIATLRRYEPHARPDEVKVIRERIGSLERRVKERPQRQQPGQEAGGTPGDTVAPAPAPVSGQVSGTAAPQEPKRPLRAWIVTGTGGALVIAGLGLGLAASATRSDIDARCGSYQGQTYCPIEAQSLIERHGRLALGADITMGVGIATAAAGVVWLLLGGGEAEAGAPAVSISPGLQEVRLVVRF
jgi:tetratricopeptide (TPR) repeat protein